MRDAAALLVDPPRIPHGPGSRERPVERFALIGDVHAEDERLETAIALARDQDAEMILCVGDVTDGFGDLARTVEILERERVTVVRGNHDRWFLADTMRTLAPVQHRAEHPRAEAAAKLWPVVLEVETVGGTLLLSHAVFDDDFSVVKSHTHEDEVREMGAWTRLLRAKRYRFMAAGHTHEVMVRTIDGITILNPGTLKRDKGPCTTLIDLRRREMIVYDLARPDRARRDRAIPIP